MKEVVILIHELIKLDKFIRQGHTVNPRAFALKMCYSKRKFYEAMSILRVYIKPFGIDIIFVESLDNYQYTSRGNFFIDIGFKHKQTPSRDTAVIQQ
jgi:hypothetical protein